MSVGSAKTPVSKVTIKCPSRVIIEGVTPEIDCGRFPIKRTVGEDVVVSADIFAEGHDLIRAAVLHRPKGTTEWSQSPMTSAVNDRWTGRFTVPALGRHEYTVTAWIDAFGSWRRDLQKRVEAGQDVAGELLEGAEFVQSAATRASGKNRSWLSTRAVGLKDGEASVRVAAALDPELAEVMDRYPDLVGSHTLEKVLGVMVERERARFGSWYETFPRSCASEPGKHGTFKDLEARLPYIAGMGFDVLYLPPIHPIGQAYRKGPNNTLTPGSDDPGSPWAIGASEGGHKSVLPELGTFADFDHLVTAAKAHGLEIALDIAFQCSPDHPYVRDHPEWFRHQIGRAHV